MSYAPFPSADLDNLMARASAVIHRLEGRVTHFASLASTLRSFRILDCKHSNAEYNAIAKCATATIQQVIVVESVEPKPT